ncbi:MAG: hypothetical protein ACE5FA_13535 [Dehalococcoidia bacterium]
MLTTLVINEREFEMAQEQDYLFDNTTDAEETRLRAVEAELDSGTIRHLQELSVSPGMHCLRLAAVVGRSLRGFAKGLVPMVQLRQLTSNLDI